MGSGKRFEEKVVDIHGEVGKAWLARLPETLAEAAARWSLTVLNPFEDLSYNYVTPALREGGIPVVIKAGVPGHELMDEIEALENFAGSGMAQLLEVDRGNGVLLLERLVPGTPLLEVEDDEEKTHIAAQLALKLWKPAPQNHSMTTIARWAEGFRKLREHFGGGCGPYPPEMVQRAEGIFADFLADQSEPVLLHGDFHTGNILRAAREPWLAIDPKGVVGNPYYDAAVFLCDVDEGLPAEQIKSMTIRRAAILSEMLDFERKLLLQAGYAFAILSGWWSIEDHGVGWEWSIERARLFESL